MAVPREEIERLGAAVTEQAVAIHIAEGSQLGLSSGGLLSRVDACATALACLGLLTRPNACCRGC